MSPLSPRSSPRVRLGSDRGQEDDDGPGVSVLNRGLGALRTRREDEDSAGATPWSAWVLLLLGALVTFPSAMSIEFNYALVRDDSFFKSDATALSAGFARLAAIPLTCAAINFLVQHIRVTTFWWERTPSGRKNRSRSRCGFDSLSPGPMALAALGLLRTACLQIVSHNESLHVSFYIEILISLIWLYLYYQLLDKINSMVKGMVKDQEYINKSPPVMKMQKLVRNITRSGRAEKDAVYCFGQTNTVPAEVLSYVWWLYYIVGKVLGALIILAIMMGCEGSQVSHFLAGSIALSAATAAIALFELGPNTLSLFRLSLNKPFYVGDLVTLNLNGAMDSTSSIMGFVENITMMYVVIRNFEMKQTWIPHKAFSEFIIQNWTRRPSKTVLLNIGVSCRCPVKKVERLTDFGKRWIQASLEIQQTNYQKCHITKTGNGYNIEVIFFPEIGVSHRGIRQKFLVAFMAAGERMQVSFVPLQIVNNFCEENATGPSAYDPGTSLDPERFTDLLPNQDDLLPKGVGFGMGLGFREFPAGHSEGNLLSFVEEATSPNMAEEDQLPEQQFEEYQLPPSAAEEFLLSPAAADVGELLVPR